MRGGVGLFGESTLVESMDGCCRDPASPSSTPATPTASPSSSSASCPTPRFKSFVTQEQDAVVDPKAIGGGDHTMFVASDHADAKQATTELLTTYGWTDVLDLALGMDHHFGVKVIRNSHETSVNAHVMELSRPPEAGLCVGQVRGGSSGTAVSVAARWAPWLRVGRP
ncbi:hypothetical protein AB0O76_06935 [Streptomyces sp. NPDC086554]|uniref:hypothetical protein n=1 Tax=Streptomyces sp. NPDC086554 TaxID=3154864 RepID=UPI003414301C